MNLTFSGSVSFLPGQKKLERKKKPSTKENIMVKNWLVFVIGILSFSLVYGQHDDSITVKQDSISQKDSTAIYKNQVDTSKIQKKVFMLPKVQTYASPGMMPMRMSENTSKLGAFKVNFDSYANPRDRLNWDAHNLPPNYSKYEGAPTTLEPKIVLPKIELPQKDVYKPLAYKNYSLPSRDELEILKILWEQGDIADTTIYLSLDSTQNVTMEVLVPILEKMRSNGFLGRELISPRNELTVQLFVYAFPVEMSPTNRRNRVYKYHCNVDQSLMKKFIRTYADLYKEDPTIVLQDKLKAARGDSVLLEELDAKIHEFENKQP